ncbi:uncharacterized protein LOC109476669 isoform X2 [Rhizophagus irregularis DAOM 181602=DAOM 197198]|nr:uncharacterized protein LOC109476669 isoform X2 [Rhizophagus irregularis DAOM 181602=DAOM 197198]
MADLIKPRKRYLYPCHCIHCDGAEVDFRTQENHTNDESLASSSNLDSSQHNSGFNPFNEDTDSFQPNNNENIHTLFSSSPLLPNPSYFHVPAPDENKDNDEYIYYNEEEKNDDNEDDGDEDDGDENNGAENNGGEDEGDYNEEEDDDDDGDDEEEEEDIEEFFSSPEIGNDEVFVMESLNDSIETEIILWLAVCNNCHKLYNVRNIVEYKEEGKAAIANCLHEEFPDNPVPSRHNKCNNPLSILKKRKVCYTNDLGLKICWNYQEFKEEGLLPIQIFIIVMYGKLSHLMVIPFLHQKLRQHTWAFSLILIGPKEVRLEHINHYLAPIVDELLELWKGWRVPKTYQYTEGLDIKVALIIGSSDTPATRKLFGHGSAVMKCHRCEKRSTYSEVYKKTHYGGMQEYDKWVTNPINPLLHRQYAHEWLQCNLKSSRDTHFKEHGVRWSELLCLPYMDSIRFAVVDPMHCLFLGIAKWIIKSIFINQNKLSMEQLRIAQKRMDYIELPSDIGRIPPKIAIGNEGFSNLTADQWKTFIMIYSMPILWDMLDNNDRKILGHFVRACNLLVARFITEDDLREAQERLKDMAHLIERTYRPEFITSNIHLALHIPDCCRDYGSIYSFWLFPYERLNGYIGSYPNSNRQIKPGLIRIVLKNTLIDYHLSYKWSSGLLKESLSLIMPKKAVGSLAFTAEKDELQYFLSMRHNTSTFFKIYGTEKLPGQMLNPSCFKVIIPLVLRRFLCEWYSILYEKE